MVRATRRVLDDVDFMTHVHPRRTRHRLGALVELGARMKVPRDRIGVQRLARGDRTRPCLARARPLDDALLREDGAAPLARQLAEPDRARQNPVRFGAARRARRARLRNVGAARTRGATPHQRTRSSRSRARASGYPRRRAATSPSPSSQTRSRGEALRRHRNGGADTRALDARGYEASPRQMRW
jgi:hypothetical protein